MHVQGGAEASRSGQCNRVVCRVFLDNTVALVQIVKVCGEKNNKMGKETTKG